MNKGDEAKQQLCRDIAKPGYEVIAKMQSPRFIKTHFPFSMLPGLLDVGCKVIIKKRNSLAIAYDLFFLKVVYVARNPKDVAVSWYNLNSSIKTQGYIGDFSTFWDYFQNDLSTLDIFRNNMLLIELLMREI